MVIPDEIKKMTDTIIPFLVMDDKGRYHLREDAPAEIVTMKEKRDRWSEEFQSIKSGGIGEGFKSR